MSLLSRFCSLQCTSMHSHARLCRFLKQSLLLLLCQLFWFEDDDDFLEGPAEPIRHFIRVVLDHWRSRVCTNIACPIQGKTNRYANRKGSFRNFLFVDKQDTRRAFTIAAPVIPKVDA